MRYINILQATPGMKVARAILNENDDILVNKDLILSESIIKKLREREVEGLYIEDALSEDIEIEQLLSDNTERKAIKALRKMDIDAALDVAELIVDEISEISDISFNMVSLRSKSDYTYKHSVNVAMYAVVIGIGIGLRKGMLKELSASALLHDIGKLQIPMKILEKPGKLTDEEFEKIRRHSEYGYELLKDNMMLTSKIKMGVYMHHENVDGTGYPLGLKEHQIYLFAKIIHIADVYDALTTERSYKKAEMPKVSMQFLMKNVGTMFQQDLVKVFINYIPVYPKGRTVRLQSEEEAVVVENRQNHTLFPIVRLLDGTTIDLYEEDSDEFEIVEIVS